jgi:hypothetical protein
MRMKDRPMFCQTVTTETATSAQVGLSSTESWFCWPSQ